MHLTVCRVFYKQYPNSEQTDPFFQYIKYVQITAFVHSIVYEKIQKTVLNITLVARKKHHIGRAWRDMRSERFYVIVSKEMKNTAAYLSDDGFFLFRRNTGYDIILSNFSSKLWIVREQFYGHFLYISNEDSGWAEFRRYLWGTLYMVSLMKIKNIPNYLQNAIIFLSKTNSDFPYFP